MTISISERHDEAVRLREAGLSYAEIGRRLGKSREWARQLVKSGPVSRKPDLGSRVMLTASDVGQLLGIHANTVRLWSNKGLLRAYRICSRGDRRFRREDIERFLEQSKQ